MARSPLIFAMTGAWGLHGGIASANRNVVLALADAARESGRAMHVLSLHETPSARPTLLAPEMTFEAFAGRRERCALRLLARTRPGAVVVFDHVTLALPLLPLAATGIARTVIFAHGSEAWKRVRRSSRASFHVAALCLANSDYTLRQMRAHLGPFRGRTCLLGLAPDFPDEGGLGREVLLAAADGATARLGNRVLLAVSRFDPAERQKGHDALVRVLPSIARACPDVQLVLAGPGEDRARVKDLALELGVGARVFLPGALPPIEIARLYELSYAFALPSLQEGFGLAYVEAMSRAKPCLGCRDQGTAEVVVDGETGVLVGGSDDAELSAALLGLLRDPAAAARMGDAGRRRYLEHFTSAHHRARVRSALLEVLR